MDTTVSIPLATVAAESGIEEDARLDLGEIIQEMKDNPTPGISRQQRRATLRQLEAAYKRQKKTNKNK